MKIRRLRAEYTPANISNGYHQRMSVSVVASPGFELLKSWPDQAENCTPLYDQVAESALPFDLARYYLLAGDIGSHDLLTSALRSQRIPKALRLAMEGHR